MEMTRLRVENGGPGDRGARVSDEVFRRSSQVVMPPFDRKTEDIDEYINQFERFAGTQQLPNHYLVTNLLALLPSTVRGVCNSMANDQRDVFEDVKRVLLQHYKLSSESFLKLFMGTSKKDEETHLQFHERLKVIFNKWLHMAGHLML